jgi:hypothetical protein
MIALNVHCPFDPMFHEQLRCAKTCFCCKVLGDDWRPGLESITCRALKIGSSACTTHHTLFPADTGSNEELVIVSRYSMILQKSL